MFLESAQFGVTWQVGVRHHNAHHRDGQQAAFMQHIVRHCKSREQNGKEHRYFHIFRHISSAERFAQAPSSAVSDNTSDCNAA